jgi:hypothetical protein
MNPKKLKPRKIRLGRGVRNGVMLQIRGGWHCVAKDNNKLVGVFRAACTATVLGLDGELRNESITAGIVVNGPVRILASAT